jgi:hypothetical protein
MDFELWYLIAVPVLFAAGWFSRGLESKQQFEHDQPPECYTRGVSLLLGDEPDRAVESFTEAVRLDPDTTELQHVLGKLYRRRGDFERAVRLHQHLFNREDLAMEERVEALRELALDYFTAGLYDRAEAAYRQLSETPSFYLEAMKKLLEIYVIEHEWQLAVDTALSIESRRRQSSGWAITRGMGSSGGRKTAVFGGERGLDGDSGPVFRALCCRKTVGFRNGRKISTKVGIDQNEQSRGTDYSKCLSPRWSRSHRKTDVSGRRTHVWQAKPNGRLLGFVSRTRQNRGRMDSPQHTFVAISRQECDKEQ